MLPLEEVDGGGKQVLMFAYRFPPCYCHPTATERAIGFASQLSSYGWDPIVVTRDPARDGCRCLPAGGEKLEADDPRNDLRGLSPEQVIRVRIGSSWLRSSRSSIRNLESPTARWLAAPIRRFLTLLRFTTKPTQGWVKQSISRGEEVMRDNRVDLVWTTTPPEWSLVVGRHFQSKYGTPWVADIRDAISRFPRDHAGSDTLPARLRRARFARPAREASAIVCVSPQEAAQDASYLERSVHTIPSGFDAEAWRRIHRQAVSRARDRTAFRMVYAGGLLPEVDHIDPFFEGLSSFLRLPGAPPLTFEYLGSNGNVVRDAARRWGLEDVVTDRGRVSLEDARLAMAGSDALILLRDVPGESGVPGGKLYDYLAAGTPILAVPGRDLYVREVLATTGAGVCAETREEIATAIGTLVSSDEAPLHDREQRIAALDSFSWAARAEALSEVFAASVSAPAAVSGGRS